MTEERFRSGTLRSEQGSVLALTVFAIVGLVGVAALAIDLGMLFTARSEAQRAAEAGAHAGAGVFLNAPNDVVTAREQARIFAELNFVRQENVALLDEDIDVVPAEQLVRVRVNRIQARGNPVATVFARIFGVDEVNVGAVAAAQSWPAGGLNCMLPFAMPDLWSEGPSPGIVPPEGSDAFGDDPDDFYIPWDQSDPDALYTGYSADDRGREVRLYSSNSGDAPIPSWWYPMAIPGGNGADWMREWILGCPNPSLEMELGDDVTVEPGNMGEPIARAFEELIDLDLSAVWDDGLECVTSGDGVCRGSPRIKPVLMFDPNDYPASGRKTLPVSNFVGVFVDRVERDGPNRYIWVRFIEYVGLNPADEWSASGPLVRVLRIVE